MDQSTPYRSITREQYLLREARIVAALRLECVPDAEIAARAKDENIFQYPMVRMASDIARVCLRRLDALGTGDVAEALTGLLAHGTLEQARQTNLYAMMRTYRIVWEFMVGVVGVKYATLDYSLPRREIVAFMDDLRQQSPVVAAWTDKGVQKVVQVLAKSLAETGLLESTRSDRLVPIYLDSELERLMRANGDAVALPAFNRIG